MEHKLYCGVRDANGRCYVSVKTKAGMRKLKPRRDIWNHSPTLEWGVGGGAAQLALALLADALDDDSLAERLHRKYAFQVTSKLPRDEWQIAKSDVEKFMADAF